MRETQRDEDGPPIGAFPPFLCSPLIPFRINNRTSQNIINEKLIDVTYIAQPDEKTCWKASYKMMLDYNSKADNLPN